MREIKFRAWDLTDKKWDIPMTDYRKEQGAKDYFRQENEVIRFNRGDIALMQFTGLLDKNGKEIWEGNIVKRFKEDKGIVIVWNKKNASFEFAVMTSFIFCQDLADRHYEVIGNIYENPEIDCWGKK